MVLRRLLCLALLLASAAVPAQEVLRHALIIGVSTYADPRVPVLEGVTHDMLSAREIALAMGVPESQITVLRDHEATKRNIVVHLERLGQRAGDGSRVLVYFSGHGTRWHDPSAGGCVEGLLTYDSQAIVNREFAALARPLSEKADKVILMFDACHSGGVGTMQSPNRSWPGGNSGMRPKFFVKADEAPTSCNRPTNQHHWEPGEQSFDSQGQRRSQGCGESCQCCLFWRSIKGRLPVGRSSLTDRGARSEWLSGSFRSCFRRRGMLSMTQRQFGKANSRRLN